MPVKASSLLIGAPLIVGIAPEVTSLLSGLPATVQIGVRAVCVIVAMIEIVRRQQT